MTPQGRGFRWPVRRLVFRWSMGSRWTGPLVLKCPFKQRPPASVYGRGMVRLRLL